MLVLGIESTCDEIGISIVRDGSIILSNSISSQVDIHVKYGGVFPELASRRHIEDLIPMIKKSFEEAGISPKDIDLISVAKGPGLIGSLVIGMTAAKTLSLAWDKPFIGVNHVEAHLYAAMMDNPRLFPAIGLVVSGGHTFITKINSIGSYELIGTTIDDAIGEAFDKVAKMLGLPYPGGPQIEKLALKGDKTKYLFKPGRVKNSPYSFSFSGLKTNVLYQIKGPNSKPNSPSIIDESEKAHIAASFQNTAFSDVIEKTLKAAKEHSAKAIYIGGGVSNSQTLRSLFDLKCENNPVYFPEKGLSLDNGAMIAGLGYHKFLEQKISDPYDLEVMTRWALPS